MALPSQMILPAVAFAILASSFPTSAQPKAQPAETRTIAEKVFVYGFPMIMNYGVMYAYVVGTTSSHCKAPFDQIYNTADVDTPADTPVITPNSNTPYWPEQGDPPRSAVARGGGDDDDDRG